MKTIGITGNSGSGKSIFSKILAQKFNAVIIDADKISKENAKKGKEYYNQIVETFGKHILKDEEIDRKKLAQIIYNNSEEKEKLDLLTNKYIVKDIKEEIEKNKNKNIVLDVPLLFETELNLECDYTISLIAKEETKIKRMCTRDNITKEIAKQRLKIQKDNDFYIKKSNYVIINEDTELETEANDFIETMPILNNKIVVVKNEKVKYIQFKELLKYKNVIHCFTLRPMDFGSNDTYSIKKEEIEKNYKILCDNLKINYKDIVRPYQTHTNNVKKVENEKGFFIEELKDIDALITNHTNEILSLTFADCTPIYIFDKEKNIISLVHSGWQGTAKSIVKNAIQELKKEYKCKVEDMLCAIGPTIRNCHFEVDTDVKEIFYKQFKYMKNIDNIIKENKKTGKSYIDTVMINKNLMLENGILSENIIDCNICTVCNSNIMHSYRKDGKDAGRNTAILGLI